MSRRRKTGLAFVLLPVLLVTSLILTGLILVYRPLPTIDGEYRLLGIDQRAEVDRDSYGVPHILAQNVHDLFYLQGYVTAQDRLFQMELYRRAGTGRLSEVLGDGALDSDRQFRIYGFARIAAQELTLLRDDTKAALRAYADGVNKFLEQHGESLPLEFVILGYRPEKWSPLDSIVVAKLQAYDAAGNMNQELLRADLALRFGPGVLPTLMPDPSGRAATPFDQKGWAQVAPMLSESSAAAGLEAFLPGAGEATGSNCWALAPSRTASGKPILVGDPHLPVRNPSIWYEIGLEGGPYKLVGFSFAGIPGIVIGHNAKIAWSFTYAYTDTQDLFVERQDPTDPRRYEYKGSFEAATVIRETIKVKGRADPDIVDVVTTRHGPIVTSTLKGQTAALALAWTALQPGRVLDFVLEIARAQSWSDFHAAAADFVGATVSACYADVDGHIGYQLIGRLPQRPSGGTMPVPGWTGEYDWTGLLPADANPWAFDPPAGIIENSNDRPVSDPDAVAYVGEWDRYEWIAGAGAAAVAATGAAVVHGLGLLRFRPVPSELARAGRVPLQVVLDFGILVLALGASRVPSRRPLRPHPPRSGRRTSSASGAAISRPISLPRRSTRPGSCTCASASSRTSSETRSIASTWHRPESHSLSISSLPGRTIRGSPISATPGRTAATRSPVGPSKMR